MRHVLVLLLALATLLGCATATSPFVAPHPAGDGPPLSADLVPFESPPVSFAQRPAGRLTVRTERVGDGARLLIGGAGSGGRRIDLSRTAGAIVFSGGPGRAIELVRLGAVPGTSWQSGDVRVDFDGWERIETPGAVYDAVRIRTTRTSGDLSVADAWWFAPGVGLVRYRQDNAGIFSMEMLRID